MFFCRASEAKLLTRISNSSDFQELKEKVWFTIHKAIIKGYFSVEIPLPEQYQSDLYLMLRGYGYEINMKENSMEIYWGM